jgi:hypothetical protein
MKKGQVKSGVSGFIMLIGILIVIFVIFMDPCEKCLLLDTDCPDVCEERIYEKVLLLENPGLVEYSDKIVHELNQFNLYIKSEPESDPLANDLRISKGLFADVDQELTFSISNFNDLKNVYLSFFVSDSQGNLFIQLNDNQIFYGKIVNGETRNIELPIAYLKEVNKLEIIVDSPGLFFWKKNFYDLKNVKIEKEFEKIHSSEDRYFVVGSNEKSSLEKTELEYSLYCISLEDDANIKIYLNDYLLNSDTITNCRETDKSLEIDEGLVKVGENVLKFLTDNGNFLVNDIKFISYTSNEILPSYSFNVMNQAGKNFKLSLVFEGNGLKEGKLYINDEELDFNTYNKKIEFDIDNYIESGTNDIEVGLIEGFNIEKLKVWYE